MNIAIATMVYNERVNLPLWVRHYTTHCPGAALFVIDHGSDDGSTTGLTGVHRIPLPRSPFDDITRAAFASHFQQSMLHFYDVIIFVDCDEMLVADPRHHASLRALLTATRAPVIAPTGVSVLHLPDREPAIDLAAPILGQRRHVLFASGTCKPSITRVPTSWIAGFHWCDHRPEYRDDLYLFHLDTMDLDTTLRRLQFTRTMAWSDRARAAGLASHQLEPDQDRLEFDFNAPARRIDSDGLASFDFRADLQRLTDSITCVDGWYQFAYFQGSIARIPDAFVGLI